MSFENFANNLLSLISVKQTNDLITVTGIKTSALMHQMQKYWGSSKLFANMFITVRSSLVTFNRFFAPDFVYILETLVANKKARVPHRTFNKIIELMYSETWLFDTKQEVSPYLNRDKLKDFKWKPLPHQEAFFDIYETNTKKYNLKGYILGAAAGSGKTALNLFLSSLVEADVFIAIVPKNSVQTVWEDTIKNIYKTKQTYWSTLSSTPLKPGLKHYIFHYERLEEAIDFFRTNKFKNPYIVLDESHNLNELNSARSNHFIELCKITGSKNILWSSGTPVKAIGNEIIPILLTIDEYFDRNTAEKFKLIYGKNASRAIDILRNRLGLMTYTVVKTDVVNNEVTYEDVKIIIPNGKDYTLEVIREKMKSFIYERMYYYKKNMNTYIKQYLDGIALYERSIRTPKDKEALEVYKFNVDQIRKFYDPATMKQMVVDCNRFEDKNIIPVLHQPLKDQFRKAKSVYKYYLLTIQGEALGQILGRARAKCHVDMVEHLHLEDYVDNAVKKTVIFTNYVEVIHKTEEYFKKRKYRPLVVYGDTNKHITQIVESFKKQADLNPLIATYQSLSTAVPLIMASTALMLNAPFRNHEYTQATARLDRLGQDSPVTIVNFFLDTGTEPNISTRNADIMAWSKEQVELMLGTKNVDFEVAVESLPEDVRAVICPQNSIMNSIYTSW